MVRVFSTLISGQGFDPRFEYRAALKLVANIYPLNRPTKCEWLVTGLDQVNTLRNKKKIYLIGI